MPRLIACFTAPNKHHHKLKLCEVECWFYFARSPADVVRAFLISAMMVAKSAVHASGYSSETFASDERLFAGSGTTLVGQHL